jgi:hypothetical protein
MKQTTLTKWIEQAEARTVCEFALTETRLANVSTVRRAGGNRYRTAARHIGRMRGWLLNPIRSYRVGTNVSDGDGLAHRGNNRLRLGDAADRLSALPLATMRS